MRLSLSYSLARGGEGGGRTVGEDMGGRQRDRLPGEGRVGGLCVPCLFLRGGLVVAHGGGGGCSGEQEIGTMEVAVDDVCRQVEADRA